ncbi:Rna pseudouridine synthase superfamily protein, partial [Cardiosporidium cionae]
ADMWGKALHIVHIQCLFSQQNPSYLKHLQSVIEGTLKKTIKNYVEKDTSSISDIFQAPYLTMSYTHGETSLLSMGGDGNIKLLCFKRWLASRLRAFIELIVSLFTRDGNSPFITRKTLTQISFILTEDEGSIHGVATMAYLWILLGGKSLLKLAESQAGRRYVENYIRKFVAFYQTHYETLLTKKTASPLPPTLVVCWAVGILLKLSGTISHAAFTLPRSTNSEYLSSLLELTFPTLLNERWGVLNSPPRPLSRFSSATATSFHPMGGLTSPFSTSMLSTNRSMPLMVSPPPPVFSERSLLEHPRLSEYLSPSSYSHSLHGGPVLASHPQRSSTLSSSSLISASTAVPRLPPELTVGSSSSDRPILSGAPRGGATLPGGTLQFITYETEQDSNLSVEGGIVTGETPSLAPQIPSTQQRSLEGWLPHSTGFLFSEDATSTPLIHSQSGMYTPSEVASPPLLKFGKLSSLIVGTPPVEPGAGILPTQGMVEKGGAPPHTLEKDSTVSSLTGATPSYLLGGGTRKFTGRDALMDTPPSSYGLHGMTTPLLPSVPRGEEAFFAHPYSAGNSSLGHTSSSLPPLLGEWPPSTVSPGKMGVSSSFPLVDPLPLPLPCSTHASIALSASSISSHSPYKRPLGQGGESRMMVDTCSTAEFPELQSSCSYLPPLLPSTVSASSTVSAPTLGGLLSTLKSPPGSPSAFPLPGGNPLPAISLAETSSSLLLSGGSVPPSSPAISYASQLKKMLPVAPLISPSTDASIEDIPANREDKRGGSTSAGDIPAHRLYGETSHYEYRKSMCHRNFLKDTPCVIENGKSWMVCYKPAFWHCSGLCNEKVVDELSKDHSMENMRSVLRNVNLDMVVSSGKIESFHLFLMKKYPEMEVMRNWKELECGLCHRTDLETSGSLLVAKTVSAREAIFDQFRKRLVHKEYLVLCHGRMKKHSDCIDEPIQTRDFDGRSKSHFSEVKKGGEKALTEYKLLKVYRLKRDVGSMAGIASGDGALLHTNRSEILKSSRSGGNSTLSEGDTLDRTLSSKGENSEAKREFSLCNVRIHTGRTHQIRVHMRHIGHPLVSDTKYLNPQLCTSDRQWCPRMFLHSHVLEFNDPDNEKRTVRAVCPLALELEAVLEHEMVCVDDFVNEEGFTPSITSSPPLASADGATSISKKSSRPLSTFLPAAPYLITDASTQRSSGRQWDTLTQVELVPTPCTGSMNLSPVGSHISSPILATTDSSLPGECDEKQAGEEDFLPPSSPPLPTSVDGMNPSPNDVLSLSDSFLWPSPWPRKSSPPLKGSSFYGVIGPPSTTSSLLGKCIASPEDFQEEGSKVQPKESSEEYTREILQKDASTLSSIAPSGLFSAFQQASMDPRPPLSSITFIDGLTENNSQLPSDGEMAPFELSLAGVDQLQLFDFLTVGETNFKGFEASSTPSRFLSLSTLRELLFLVFQEKGSFQTFSSPSSSSSTFALYALPSLKQFLGDSSTYVSLIFECLTGSLLEGISLEMLAEGDKEVLEASRVAIFHSPFWLNLLEILCGLFYEDFHAICRPREILLFMRADRLQETQIQRILEAMQASQKKSLSHFGLAMNHLLLCEGITKEGRKSEDIDDGRSAYSSRTTATLIILQKWLYFSREELSLFSLERGKLISLFNMWIHLKRVVDFSSVLVELKETVHDLSSFIVFFSRTVQTCVSHPEFSIEAISSSSSSPPTVKASYGRDLLLRHRGEERYPPSEEFSIKQEKGATPDLYGGGGSIPSYGISHPFYREISSSGFPPSELAPPSISKGTLFSYETASPPERKQRAEKAIPLSSPAPSAASTFPPASDSWLEIPDLGKYVHHGDILMIPAPPCSAPPPPHKLWQQTMMPPGYMLPPLSYGKPPPRPMHPPGASSTASPFRFASSGQGGPSNLSAEPASSGYTSTMEAFSSLENGGGSLYNPLAEIPPYVSPLQPSQIHSGATNPSFYLPLPTKGTEATSHNSYPLWRSLHKGIDGISSMEAYHPSTVASQEGRVRESSLASLSVLPMGIYPPPFLPRFSRLQTPQGGPPVEGFPPYFGMATHEGAKDGPLPSSPLPSDGHSYDNLYYSLREGSNPSSPSSILASSSSGALGGLDRGKATPAHTLTGNLSSGASPHFVEMTTQGMSPPPCFSPHTTTASLSSAPSLRQPLLSTPNGHPPGPWGWVREGTSTLAYTETPFPSKGSEGVSGSYTSEDPPPYPIDFSLIKEREAMRNIRGNPSLYPHRLLPPATLGAATPYGSTIYHSLRSATPHGETLASGSVTPSLLHLPPTFSKTLPTGGTTYPPLPSALENRRDPPSMGGPFYPLVEEERRPPPSNPPLAYRSMENSHVSSDYSHLYRPNTT